MNLQLTVILVYSAALLAVGLRMSRRVRLASDFLVAGRTLGPGFVFASFLAANVGAGSTVGAAGLGYARGWSAWWWVGSAGAGCVFLAHFVGPKIWRLARTEGFRSLGDFLEWRYDRRVRLTAAGVVWGGSIFLLAAQLVALSLLLQVVAGVPPWTGALVGGLLMTTYFTAGGLLSSAAVNVVQLGVLLAGFLLAVPFSISSAGGWSAMNSAILSGVAATKPGYLDPLAPGVRGVLHYLALLAPSFIVSPGLIQKVYTARSESAVRTGVTLNAIFLLAFAAIPPLLGISAAVRYPALADPQFALFKTVTVLLPPWLSLLALAAVFSAEVSTCDAVLSMLATGFTVDLYRGWLRPTAGERELLHVSRLSAAGAGLLAIAIATLTPTIIGALSVFYGVVSVALFAPVVCGLYSAKPDARAALLAIVISLPTAVAVQVLPAAAAVWPLNPVATGIAVSFVVILLAVRRPHQP